MTNGRVHVQKTDPLQLAEVKAKMAEHGITYKELASLMGVCKSVASQYLYGYRNLLPERYEKFMKGIKRLERQEKELEDILGLD